jgi:hypothetical protein
LTAAPRYRSKIAAVWVVLALSCLAALLAAMALRGQDPGLSRLLRGAAMAVAMAFVCAAVPCRYVLRPDRLSVQSGFFIRHIPYSEILEATPARDWTWAPALSPDRLLLRCVHGYVRVSPVRQQEFLAELRNRLPAGSVQPAAR